MWPCHRFRGVWGGVSPCRRKGGIAGPSGHCVRDARPLQDCGARGKLRSTLLAVLRRSRPFQHFLVWGEAPCASIGVWGDASPHKAQRRHRGARSAMASAMRVLCKIAELAENTLAVLRRSRPSHTQSCHFCSPFDPKMGSFCPCLHLAQVAKTRLFGIIAIGARRNLEAVRART